MRKNNNTRYQGTQILNLTNYCLGFVEEQLLTSSQPNLEYEKCRKIISPSIIRLVYSMKDNVAVSRFIHRFVWNHGCLQKSTCIVWQIMKTESSCCYSTETKLHGNSQFTKGETGTLISNEKISNICYAPDIRSILL